jgi:TatD DNase family protein
MRLIDTHIHLTSPRYADLPGLVTRAQQAGIAGVVAAAVDEASSYQVLALRETFPSFVLAGLGVHPERQIGDDETARVIALIHQERSRLVAIAEVGLPWYSIRERADRNELIAAGEPRLRRFLRVARELDLAVVLHAPHNTAERALSLLTVEQGYYISVTPETCYRQRDQELVTAVPLSNLVIETDGPWPYNGEFEQHPTEPTFLARVVDAVARLKGVTPTEVGHMVTQNTRRLFRLP